MKPTPEQHNKFLARLPLPGIELQHNDYVKVVRGQYAPDAGSVVSIWSLGRDPVYLIELESGKDQQILQSCLEFVAHD